MDRDDRGRVPVMGEAFESVLAAAQTGAPWALEQLYRSVASAVVGYLRIQGSLDADDLASDVLYRALSSITTFAGDEAKFRSWVFTIAHNGLIDERRRVARRPVAAEATVDDLALSAGDVEEEAIRRLGTERVRHLCERLTPDQRDVLLLRMAAGMTLEETAAALGRTTGAVKALQHRAVAELRRQLAAEAVSQ